MEFLGVGPLELFFILLIALIVLGPNDMVKAGRTLGRWMRKIVTSPAWRTVQQTSRDLRYLPNKLMRDAGLEELKESMPSVNQIRKEAGLDKAGNDLQEWKADLSAWTTPPTILGMPVEPGTETIESPPAPGTGEIKDDLDSETDPSEGAG